MTVGKVSVTQEPASESGVTMLAAHGSLSGSCTSDGLQSWQSAQWAQEGNSFGCDIERRLPLSVCAVALPVLHMLATVQGSCDHA